MNSSKENNEYDENADTFISANLELFSSFYPFFYILESLLKERLYNQLKNKLGDEWFTLKLAKSDPLFEEERANILRRKPKNFLLKDKGLLVESGLGFWIEFFNRRLYKETKGTAISIFKNLPPEIKRKHIYQKLSSVREFRNLLFHSRIPLILNMADTPALERLNLQAENLEAILRWFGGLSESIVDSQHIQAKIIGLRKRLELKIVKV